MSLEGSGAEVAGSGDPRVLVPKLSLWGKGFGLTVLRRGSIIPILHKKKQAQREEKTLPQPLTRI